MAAGRGKAVLHVRRMARKCLGEYCHFGHLPRALSFAHLRPSGLYRGVAPQLPALFPANEKVTVCAFRHFGIARLALRCLPLSWLALP